MWIRQREREKAARAMLLDEICDLVREGDTLTLGSCRKWNKDKQIHGVHGVDKEIE